MKTTKELSATQAFAKNIVKAIQDKVIEIKEPVNLKTKDASGQRYASVKAVPGVVLDVLKKEDQKNPRYVLTVSFPSKKKGFVNKHVITGFYARQAFKVLNTEPKRPRKVELPAEDLALATKAFGF